MFVDIQIRKMFLLKTPDLLLSWNQKVDYKLQNVGLRLRKFKERWMRSVMKYKEE